MYELKNSPSSLTDEALIDLALGFAEHGADLTGSYSSLGKQLNTVTWILGSAIALTLDETSALMRAQDDLREEMRRRGRVDDTINSIREDIYG